METKLKFINSSGYRSLENPQLFHVCAPDCATEKSNNYSQS